MWVFGVAMAVKIAFLVYEVIQNPQNDLSQAVGNTILFDNLCYLSN